MFSGNKFLYYGPRESEKDLRMADEKLVSSVLEIRR